MSDILSISNSNVIKFPYQQACANFKSAFSSEQQNFFKRIARIVFAILEIVPGAGLFVALIDSKWFFQNRITAVIPKPAEAAPVQSPKTPTAPEEAVPARDYRKIVIGSAVALSVLGISTYISYNLFSAFSKAAAEAAAKAAAEAAAKAAEEAAAKAAEELINSLKEVITPVSWIPGKV